MIVMMEYGNGWLGTRKIPVVRKDQNLTFYRVIRTQVSNNNMALPDDQ